MRVAILAAGVLALGAVSCAGRSESRAAGMREAPRVLLSADALLFASFDANDDLRIDAAEIEAGVAREWARGDANNDGEMAPIEYQAWMNLALGGSNAPPYRLDFDRNVDNAITRAEFETELRSRAADYDENSDGVLARAEFMREAPQPQVTMGGERMRRRASGP